MNISITPHQEKLIENKVKSGSYLSASEVVRTALRLLEEQDRARQNHLELIRSQVKRGKESGGFAPFDAAEFIRRGEARHRNRRST